MIDKPCLQSAHLARPTKPKAAPDPLCQDAVDTFTTKCAMQVLVIVAASHLDAVTFQICSQSFKIMPTALFAVWLLGQYLTPMQWASLPVLAVGVVLVTMNGSTGQQH